ncbi:hypothetical protein [Aeromicrobium wangtongii]|uniref:DUF1795 domain-containing protein n=1 Tax=Aeromicrobium wangtongii TaxID=2969247 RepID=A0ABY5MCY5_9ACTN|nr:hypothetical protein [Aeromicrobium wangtongii]MCD9199315.1 hypothetical protein [Aeromicrobium wangtongii]UUP13676.1 hypothetical protein NQV15_17775 [Aeromicrobium wangtongii]
MNEHIELGEHAYWAPIPLDEDPEVIRQRYAAGFTSSTLDADAGAAAMAGVAAQLQAPTADGTVNLAAWARVGVPNELDVQAFAALRVVPLEEDARDEDVIALLTEGHELYQEPVVETLSTRSGDALSVRVRPLVHAEDGQIEVHQINTVLWSRPQHAALFVLSSYETDLVEATAAAILLDELAAGIGGMSS